MPQFERRLYEPEDLGTYDASDDDMEDEGSRLPLLIVIALVVLASFAGVVWLAYTQGVQRGREDAPRIVAAQQNKHAVTESKNPYSDLKIYRSPKGNEETSDNPAPAATQSVPKAAASEHPVSKADAAPAAEAPVVKPNTQRAARPAIAKPQVTTPAAAMPRNTAPAATAAPRVIAPLPAKPKSAPQTNAKSTASADTAGIDKVLAAQQAPAAPQAAPATQRAGGYVLQIGSFTSAAEANASWQAYKAAHTSVAGYAPDVAQADLGSKGTWYRLRVGPFATLGEASAACARLKAQGGKCFPAKR